MAQEEFEMSAADGIQPQDNPDPAALGQPVQSEMPAPVKMPQMQAASMESMGVASQGQEAQVTPTAPTPAAPIAAQSPDTMADEERLNSVIKSLSKSAPKKETEKLNANDTKVKDLITRLKASESDSLPEGRNAIEERLAGEPFWDGFLRSHSENAKVLITKVRAQLDSDPAMKADVFREMYGEENVREKDGAFQFRPDKGRKWRAVDSPHSDRVTDFFTTNVLKALPMAANMLAQLRTAALAGPGATTLPVQTAAGAAGGAAEALVSEGIKSVVDPLLGISPARQPLMEEIAKEAGYNAAAPLVFRGIVLGGKAALGVGSVAGSLAMKIPPVRAAANTIGDALSSFAVGESGAVTLGDVAVLKGGQWWNQKYAQVREGFNSFREVFFPGSLEVASKDVGKKIVGEAEYGMVPTSAMEVAQKRLGEKIGIYKNEALRLAGKQRQPVNNTLSTVREILEANNYGVDPETGRMMPIDGADLSLSLPEMSAPLKKMAEFYDRISKEGSNLDGIYNDIELIGKLAKYDKRTATPAQTEVAKTWRRIYGAMASDRDQVMDGVFKVSNSPYKKQWEGDFKSYAQNADSIWEVQSQFRSPVELEGMVTTLANSSPAQQAETLDNIAMVIGKDSTEFKNLQGAVYGGVLDRFSKEGPIDTASFLKYMNDKKNAPMIERLFTPKEKKILTEMIVAGDQASQRAALTEANKDKLIRGTGWLSSMANDGYAGAKQIFQSVRGDVATVNYLLDDGFTQAAKRAEGPGMRKRIMAAANAMDEMVSKMPIIDVPVYLKDGTKRVGKKYAPYAGPALADQMEKNIEPKVEVQQP